MLNKWIVRLFFLLLVGCTSTVGTDDDVASDDDATADDDATTDDDATSDDDSTADDDATSDDDSTPSQGTGPGEPMVERGGTFMGFPEEFNRYYTDPEWESLRTRYVSRNGAGSGGSAADPAAVQPTLDTAQPGDRIVFLKDDTPYSGCYEVDEAHGGTYDQPVVLYGERNPDESLGVVINCCGNGRKTCINLEYANYVAVDGFEVNGGDYGVRTVGGYANADHVKGNAVSNCFGHDQYKDPFLTGGADWFVIESNQAARGGDGDGHGIYIGNGPDWNIVRFNDLFDNGSADFQINADPGSTCLGEGIPYDDPECDGPAEKGQGAGVAEYIHVEGNYFHDGQAQGANFTSVRNSVIRNNVFAFYQRHGVSFWQETNNPSLGSSDNVIHHNLFIGSSDDQVLLFYNDSDRNDVRNNVLATLTVNHDSAVANPDVPILAVEESVVANTYGGNLFIGGYCAVFDLDFNEVDGCEFDASDTSRPDFSATWFEDFPFDAMGMLTDYTPGGSAPWLDGGERRVETPWDWTGTPRGEVTELGPVEVP